MSSSGVFLDQSTVGQHATELPAERLSGNWSENSLRFLFEFHPVPAGPGGPRRSSDGGFVGTGPDVLEVVLPARCNVRQLRLRLYMQAQQQNWLPDPLGLLDPEEYILLYARAQDWYEVYDDYQIVRTLDIPWSRDAIGRLTARIVVTQPSEVDLKERREQQKGLVQLIGHDLDSEAPDRLGELMFTRRTLASSRRRELSARDEKAYATEPWTTAFPVPKDLQAHLGRKLPVTLHHLSLLSFTVKVDLTATPDILLKVFRQVMADQGLDRDPLDALVLKVSGREEFLAGDFSLSDFLWVRQCLKSNQELHLSVVPVARLVDEAPALVDWPLVDSFTGRSSSHEDLRLEGKDSEDVFMISLWDCHRRFRVKLLGFDVPTPPNKAPQSAYVEVTILLGNKVLSTVVSSPKAFADEVLWNEWLEFDMLLRDLPRGTKLGLTINTNDSNCGAARESKSLSPGATKAPDGQQKGKSLSPGATKAPDGQQKGKGKVLYFVNLLLIDHRSLLSQGPHTLHMWPYPELEEEAFTYPADKLSSATNPDVSNSMAITILLDRYNFPVVLPCNGTATSSSSSPPPPSPEELVSSEASSSSNDVAAPSASPSSSASRISPSSLDTGRFSDMTERARSANSPAGLSPTPPGTGPPLLTAPTSPTPPGTGPPLLPAPPTPPGTGPPLLPASPTPPGTGPPLLPAPTFRYSTQTSPSSLSDVSTSPPPPPRLPPKRRSYVPTSTSSKDFDLISSSPNNSLPAGTTTAAAALADANPPTASTTAALLAPPQSSTSSHHHLHPHHRRLSAADPTQTFRSRSPAAATDRSRLRRFREESFRYASNLPQYLRSVDWVNRAAVGDVHWLLGHWEQPGELELSVALELLGVDFVDERVRRLAVRRLEVLSNDDVLKYLLQLVQILKVEPYHDSFLAQYLIRRALRSKRIGHFFFWYVRSEVAGCPYFRQRMAVVLEAYLLGCGKAMLEGLVEQVQAVRALEAVAGQIKQLYDRPALELPQPATVAMKLQDLLRKVDLPSEFLVPFDPRIRAGRILLDKCKVMASKKKPLWLEFCPMPSPVPATPVGIIFKQGDDLRQDMLVIQTLVVMDSIWQERSLDLCLVPYGCISTGQNVGMIEIVRDAVTIATVQTTQGARNGAFAEDALFEWLKNKCPFQEIHCHSVERFVNSCAGYCVATYVLGIGDRHNDNIMITDQGNLFHIDFGHILGHRKRFLGVNRERVPFVLTPDFLYVMGRVKGRTSLYFQRFRDTCVQAYLSLRSHHRLLVTLFSLMLLTGIPELSSAEDMRYLREALQEDRAEDVAREHFLQQIALCEDEGWTVQANWWIHNMIHH